MRFFLFSLLLVLFSCKDSSVNNRTVARVGGSILLEKKMLEASLENTTTRNEAVGQWITEEILYEHASESGFRGDVLLKELAHQFDRRLVGQKYLKHLAEQKINISNDEMFKYYTNMADGFKRTKNAAKVYHFLLNSKADADVVTHTLGASGKKKEKNELFLEYGIHPITVTSGNLLPELEKTLFTKKSAKKLFGPLKSKYGYHVFFVLEKYSAGSAIPLEEVYDEIYQRIFQQKLALISLHILDSLRSQTPYTIN